MVVIAVAMTAVAAVPASVEAQGWLSDRSRNGGPGFEVGDFVLHPGIGVEVGYDSNLYYTEDGADVRFRDSGILRATAHLNFTSQRGQRAQEGEDSGGDGSGGGVAPVATFSGGLSGSFYTFFNDLDRTNMEVDANLALNILPGRTFSISLTEAFGRSVRPFTENTMPGASFARMENVASLQLSLATAGQILKVTLGYTNTVQIFEDALFSYANRMRNELSLRETFRFLPQTAIVHETRVRFLSYLGNTRAGSTLLNNGISLRTRVGLNGAFTTNFSVLVAAGYSAGFFDSDPSGSYDQEYESVTAHVEARWQIEEATRLVFGYDRDFQPSYVGNWYRRDRGYASFQTLLAGQFLLGVDASFGYYEFGSIVEPDGVTPVGSSTQRGDYRINAGLFAEYRFTDWLGINGTVNYTGNITDYSYEIDDPTGMPATFLDPARFNKVTLWLGVRVFY